MTERGGLQRIPRPVDAREGGPPPWAQLTPEERRFTSPTSRAACATLPPPRRPTAPSTARPAAVLMAVFDEAGEARVILTKRPETMPSHQGEIAFPGGKLEERVDAALRDAALREAHEEIGLDPASVEMLAELDSLTTVAGRFLLTPFVGAARRPARRSRPTPTRSCPSSTCRSRSSSTTMRTARSAGTSPPELGPEAGMDRAIHFFELPGETVWGATARILVAFLEHLTSTR